MPPSPLPALNPDQILSRLEKLGIRLGLESVRDLLARFGSPQLHYRTVLVAGSNGKGSTSALLASMSSAAGWKTGLYTSPHLESVEERLRIDGQAIASGEFAELLERIIEAAGTEPTYFEAVTAAAFLWFSLRKVDLAVMEVGMGGRLDATNVCEPELSLITSISLEHKEHLGDTLAAIAREKAGTFRPGRPALVWLEDPEPVEAVKKVAAELGTDLRFAPELVTIRQDGRRVKLTTPKGEHDLELALAGRHQARNLALAVLAAEELGIGLEAIAEGAKSCRWPGRLEKVELPEGRTVLLDAAHNPEGAGVLAEYLEGPVDLLFGVLGDKDVTEMLVPLAAKARKVILTTPASDRARSPEELAALLPGREGVEVVPDLGEALDQALQPGVDLVVCGSIYLIGEVRKRLRERFGVPEPAVSSARR